jgi:hypothetical protein
MRVQGEHVWCPPIPIPLFLLWILLILLSPLILVGLLALWMVCIGMNYPMWRALGVLWSILCALPGTAVRVTAEGRHINVRII